MPGLCVENTVPNIIADSEILFRCSIVMNEVVAAKLSQDAALWAILMAGIMNKIVGYIASEKAQKKCCALMAA